MEFKMGMPLTEGYYCKDIKVDKLDNHWRTYMQNVVVIDPVIVLYWFDLVTI